MYRLRPIRCSRTISNLSPKHYPYMSLPNRLQNRITIPPTLSITLTDTEDQVCQLLDSFVNETQDTASRTTCRIAGGWVRDKLLGTQSNDLDIALSNIMGLSFAEELAAYAKGKGVNTGTISKIAQNPDQSKHLETATFKIFGLDLDLVNLRNEEYSSDSRIPTGVSFGTPLQDALRRDITINALFYNVHSRSVEDFTEKGLDDLKNGVIRTPLPPRETFLDDPLRVLRCIRFASRFGFDIVQGIEEATKDPVIQEALVTKVARERVGEELSKMMKGRDPFRSLELIHYLSLYEPIFWAVPSHYKPTISGSPNPLNQGLAAAAILHFLLENRIDPRLPKLHDLYSQAVKTDPTCTSRLYLATSLTPYREMKYRDKKGKELPVVELIIRDSLKLGTQNHFLDGIPLLFAAHRRIPAAIAQSTVLHRSERSGLGLLLREKAIHNPAIGSHWTSSFLFSLVQDLVPHYNTENETFAVDQSSEIICKYNHFAETIDNYKLSEVGEMRPLLDGREVVVALEAKKPGPWVGQVLNKVVEWQLEYTEGAKEDCIAWLREQKQAGHIQLDNADEPASKRPKTKR